LNEDFKFKVLEGVLHHNLNDTLGLCKESYILMDADELDEIGATSILWDTLAENHENETMSYKSALLRTKKYMPALYKNISKFHFDYKEAEEELEIEL
jgi:hypothetical protein